MNIDDRIEALTQSLELLSSLHRDLEKKSDERFARIDGYMDRLTTAMTQLVDIVKDHERRIDRLEQ